MAAEPTKIARAPTSDATVLDRPSPSLSAASASSATVITTEQAMALIEAKRAWAFSLGLGVACFAGLGVVAVCGGDPVVRVVHAGALVATAVAAFGHVVAIRDLSRHRRWMVVAVAAVSTLANASGYMYWGAFSAYAAVVPVSAYGYASGSGRLDGVGIAVFSVVSHTAAGLSQIYGWTAATTIIPLPGLSNAALLFVLAVLQGVTLAALAGGNHAYRAMQQVVADHGAAIRQLSLRDAQLAEAHEAARVARRGPDEGRHSGEQLGRFKLGAVLGRGAMGEVYAAVDDHDAPCAVKVLAAAMLHDDAMVRRFQREARAIASLASPHVVKLIDVSPAGAALPFIAMERLAGQDLGELIKERPVRTSGEVAAIIRAVAAGLDAAHDAGVVHRDLKPANLFRATGDGAVTWKILDFGVSKMFASDGTLTSGQVIGTPGYMAPEQARGDAVDRRADVYSLGVVAYRLLTGRPAVVPGDVPAMIHEVVYRMPPAPSSIGAVSDAVEDVLAVALAKTPGERFATAGELARALDDAVADTPAGEIAARAAALIAKTPWGQWLRRADKDRVKTVSDQRMP